MFIWKIDRFKIIFFKDDFWSKVVFYKDNFRIWLKKKVIFVKTTFTDFLNLRKIRSKIDFCKDNFHVFLNLRKIWTMSILNMIFTRKIVFKKNDFESVHFSNKLQKSCLAPKKKKKMHFLTSLAHYLLLSSPPKLPKAQLRFNLVFKLRLNLRIY